MESLTIWFMAANPGLKSRWEKCLTTQGWSVMNIQSSQNLAKVPHDMAGSALLDASLLKESDMPIVKTLSAAKIPVILFGEGPEATNEKVVYWLRAGADDFIPASIQEKLLAAKLEAYARRILPEMDRIVLSSPNRKVKADPKRGLAWVKNHSGQWNLTSALTKTEHRILCLFLSSPETPLERDFILDSLWGEKAEEIFDTTLTQHVMSLRKKMGSLGKSIRTVYGRGYIFLEEK
jgi:DNA-binding response OmpR family regulator